MVTASKKEPEMVKRAFNCFKNALGRLGFILAIPFIILAIIAIAIDAGRTDDPY